MLEVTDLTVSYGEIRALTDVSLSVDEGEVVTVIGANGAGKTTLVRTISGLVRAQSGEISFRGRDIGSLSPDAIVRLGVVHVPEGRGIFPDLTVAENLTLGAYTRDDGSVASDRRRVLDLFPRLRERETFEGSALSGGEQQMLAIARGLMGDPDLLLLDEPSLGLAPKIIENIEGTIRELNDRGLTVLLIEQNADVAMRLADRAYALQNGTVKLSGDADELRKRDEIRETYLGL
jgi:branched-chain amino acid transport system ATP-binding protein